MDAIPFEIVSIAIVALVGAISFLFHRLYAQQERQIVYLRGRVDELSATKEQLLRERAEMEKAFGEKYQKLLEKIRETLEAFK